MRVPAILHLGATAVLSADLVAGAALAFWTLVRFPDFRPRSLVGILAAFVAAQVVASFAPLLIRRAIELDHGVVVSLVGIVLPIFFLLFLTGAWLLRALVELIGGGGGGHGIRQPRSTSA
jgi:hypothetical protein